MVQLGDKGLVERDFEFIREILREHVGISLRDNKRSMVQGRLVRRARALGMPDLDSYMRLVRRRDTAEIEGLINALTTNLTSFFREKHHFDCVKQLVKEHAANRKPRLRIWSSACSTGQEPYSIALTLREALPSGDWDARILATDVDSDVLTTAREGEYSVAGVEGLSSSQRAHFTPTADGARICADRSLKSLITFRRLNLLEDWPMRGPFDAIFCRNVLIYFDVDLQRQLVSRFVPYVRPGGYLFLGHSESLCGAHPELQSMGNTTFRRRAS